MTQNPIVFDLDRISGACIRRARSVRFLIGAFAKNSGFPQRACIGLYKTHSGRTVDAQWTV